MSYIVQADLETHFGTDNITKWSNLDNTSESADTDRIDEAIAVSEDHVNNRFRGGRYAVPLVATSGTLYKVKDWAAKLAGIWLYEHRGLHDENDEGNLLEDMRLAVEQEIDKYLAGEAELAAQLSESGPSAPIVV